MQSEDGAREVCTSEYGTDTGTRWLETVTASQDVKDCSCAVVLDDTATHESWTRSGKEPSGGGQGTGTGDGDAGRGQGTGTGDGDRERRRRKGTGDGDAERGQGTGTGDGDRDRRSTRQKWSYDEQSRMLTAPRK